MVKPYSSDVWPVVSCVMKVASGFAEFCEGTVAKESWALKNKMPLLWDC